MDATGSAHDRRPGREASAVASVRVCRHSRGATAVVSAFIHPHWRGPRRGPCSALLAGRARRRVSSKHRRRVEGAASISNIVDARMTDRRRLYIAAASSLSARIRSCTAAGWRRGARARVTDTASCRGMRFRRTGRTIPWKPSSSRSVRRCAPVVGRRIEPLRPRAGRSWPWTPTAGVVGYAITGRPRAALGGHGPAPRAYIYLSASHRGAQMDAPSQAPLLGHAVAQRPRPGASRIGLGVDMSSGRAHKDLRTPRLPDAVSLGYPRT